MLLTMMSRGNEYVVEDCYIVANIILSLVNAAVQDTPISAVCCRMITISLLSMLVFNTAASTNILMTIPIILALCT